MATRGFSIGELRKMSEAISALQGLAREYDDAEHAPWRERRQLSLPDPQDIESHRVIRREHRRWILPRRARLAEMLRAAMNGYLGIFVVVSVARFNDAFDAEYGLLDPDFPDPMGFRESQTRQIYDRLSRTMRQLTPGSPDYERPNAIREVAQIYLDLFIAVVDGRDLFSTTISDDAACAVASG